MAFENKVILKAAVHIIGSAKSLKAAYNGVVSMASVEGLEFPTFEKFKEQLEKDEDDE
jgi:hypothetical protein